MFVPPARSYFGAMLLAVTLSATALVVVSGERFLAVRRAEAENLARVQSLNLARALEQNLSGTLRRIDQALCSVVGELAEARHGAQPDLGRLERFLVMEGRLLPEPGILWIADAHGRAIVGNRSISVVPPWEGRRWFQQARTHPDAGLIVARPIIGFLTHEWVIPCVRRYNLPDGTFGGVVVIPLSVGYLEKQLKGFELGPGGTLNIRDGEGGFIARYPAPAKGFELKVGELRSSVEFMNYIRSGQEEQVHFTASPFDGTPRLYANRRVKGSPLVAGAGLAEADYLAQWRRDRARTLGIMGLALAGIWTFTWLFRNAWRSQERNARALAMSEERFRYVSSSMMDLAYSCTRGTGEDFYIDWMAGATNLLLGRSVEEIMAMGGWGKLVLAEDRPLYLEHVVGLAAGASGSCELRLVKKDGTVAWFETYAQCEVTGGQTAAGHRDEHRIYGALVDITERKLAEATLRESQNQLNQMQKMDSLGQLAGGVAHDMNNVLAAIQAVTQTLAYKRAEDPELITSLGIVEQAANRGRDLVKGLTNFARKDIREAVLMDLNTLVREEMEILRRTTRQRVELVLDLFEPLPAVLGEKSALGSALMNLCVNAVDAMPEGGTLTLRTCLLDVIGGPAMVGLEVADTGTGMTPEVQARALEPFFTTKAVGKGTGLGLSSVYATAKAHGGSVVVHSEPGRGTLIRVQLPAARKAVAVEAAPRGEAQAMASLKILLVDDDDLIRGTVPGMLGLFGHRVSTVSGGEEALRLLAGDSGTDLVILDLNMPGLNGLETLRAMRKLGLDQPVLLATGHLDADCAAVLEEDPRARALAKPFTLEALGDKLRDLAALPHVAGA